MSERVIPSAKTRALLLTTLLSVLVVGLPAQAQAKALASVALDISTLVWLWDQNDDTVFGSDGRPTAATSSDDVPISAFTRGDVQSTGQLAVRADDDFFFSSQDRPTVQATLRSDSATSDSPSRGPGTSAPLAWNDYDVPLDLAVDCPPDGACAGADAGVSEAEVSLANAIFGFGYYENGSLVAPAGGVLSASAVSDIPGLYDEDRDVTGVTRGSAVASTRSQVVFDLDLTSAISTYFALSYALSFETTLEGETNSQVEPTSYVRTQFRMSSGGDSGGFSWRPGDLNGCFLLGQLPSGFPTCVNNLASSSGTIYSTDFRINPTTFESSFLSLSLALDAVAASTTPAPSAATLALLLIGIFAGAAVHRRGAQGLSPSSSV